MLRRLIVASPTSLLNAGLGRGKISTNIQSRMVGATMVASKVAPTSNTQPTTASRPLHRILDHLSTNSPQKALAYHEATFNPKEMSLLEYAKAPYEARDVVLVLFKAHSETNRMDAARQLLLVALRDLPKRHVNAALFEGYLQALASTATFSRQEVFWVLDLARKHLGDNNNNSVITEKMYLSLAEMHIRMEVDPKPLWLEVLEAEKKVSERQKKQADDATLMNGGANQQLFVSSPPPVNHMSPSLALVKMTLLQSALHHKDFSYSLEVMRRMLRQSPVQISLLSGYFSAAAGANDVSTEQALWLLFEIEQRCVFAKQTLSSHLQKKDIVRLLLKCAQCGDAPAAERTLAVMERQLMTKTADVYALMVWVYATHGDVAKAFTTVEKMAQKGFLDHTDPFRRYTLETLGYTMDRHFLMVLADSLYKASLADEAYFFLEKRFKEKLSVSTHSLDVIVLACSKLGDDSRAASTVETYTDFNLQPRTETYNNLLLACVGRNKAKQHRVVFDAMIRNGVTPNQQTFRLLIRQAVLSDNIEEAIAFLKKVPTVDNVRVEVEMLLPIMERASRVGDVDTVYKMCKYSIDCDIGVDAAVLNKLCTNLRNLQMDVASIEELIPMHEQLRNRSKYTRRRMRHDLAA